MPTAANLNLYRGWKSCVGWHCDDEPLFGNCGDAKLIVSVSLGNFALFRWRRQSCSSDEGRSCRLGHGDILVMDGQFLHRILVGNRNGFTFRWVKQHVSSCPLFKAVVCQRVRRVHPFLLWGRLFTAFFCFFFWFLPWCLVHMGTPSFAGLLVVYKTSVIQVCLLLDTPFGRRSVGGVTFVTCGENTSKFIKLPTCIVGVGLGFSIYGRHICQP